MLHLESHDQKSQEVIFTTRNTSAKKYKSINAEQQI